MAFVWILVVIAVAGIVVAVSWDAFLRGRHGRALILGALALATLIVAGVLRANDVSPWSLVALIAGIVFTALSDRARRRSVS